MAVENLRAINQKMLWSHIEMMEMAVIFIDLFLWNIQVSDLSTGYNFRSFLFMCVREMKTSIVAVFYVCYATQHKCCTID